MSTLKLNTVHIEEQHFKKTEVVSGLSGLGYIGIKIFEPLPSNLKVVAKGARYVHAQSLEGQSDDE